jgi:hypothetical protein
MRNKRYKVRLQCKRCGERYILRGKRNKQGNIETGFKRCICDNAQDFDVITEEL